jgi:MinD-like ATPase involved in chromosome partitioning or flagellar assembly
LAVVLVTVLGPAGSLDLVVPADTPIGTLLGALARRHDAAGEARSVPPHGWSLAPLDRDPLSHDRSLSACGVGDGAVLVLSDGSSRDPAAAAPVPRMRRCAVVGVLSAAAGLGRTTVTALLAGALAEICGDLTVAVDAHPGVGSLSERLAPDHQVTAGDLLALIDHPALTREELVACLAGRDQGLAVLASRSSRGGPPPLDQRDWVRLGRGLARNGFPLVLDCGPGLGDPGARAALATADQIVLVAEPHPSPASRWMARTLVDKGLPVVVVPARASPAFDATALAGQLPGVRGVVPLPHNPGAGRLPGPLPRGAAEAILPRAGNGIASFSRDRARRPRPTAVQRPRDGQARRLAHLLVADWTALGVGGDRNTPPDPGFQEPVRRPT